MPALFVTFSVFPCITEKTFAFSFLGLFCRILKHDLNEECFLFTCPEKNIYDEEVWYACLFHPCGEQEKTFITTLLCADKVSLFIQSGRDKPWMKHCGAERERKRWLEREGSSLLVNCLCVSMWADGILENQPCSGRRLELDPPPCSNPPPPPLPPAASFPASTCPLPALIHSHYETACIMLSNRNNPQEMEHPYVQ